LELPLLLSLGALASESLSTRRDSVLAPDRLCVDEDLLEPDDRLRELERERDDRLFDFFEELPPERLLPLDRDFCWGILPALLLKLGEPVFGRLPESRLSNTPQAVVQIRCSAGKTSGPPVRQGAAGTEAKRGDNHGPDNAILEQPVNPQPLELEQIHEQKRLLQNFEGIKWQEQQEQQERLLELIQKFQVEHRNKKRPEREPTHELRAANELLERRGKGRWEGCRVRLEGEDAADGGRGGTGRNRWWRCPEEPQRLAAPVEGTAERDPAEVAEEHGPGQGRPQHGHLGRAPDAIDRRTGRRRGGRRGQDAEEAQVARVS
jgi:hypothetical protein